MDAKEKLADAVAKELGRRNGNALLDPSILVLIQEVILSIMELFKACRADSNTAVRIMRNPTFLHRQILYLRVRRVLGRQAWRDFGHDMVSSLLEVGKAVEHGDVEGLYAEL